MKKLVLVPLAILASMTLVSAAQGEPVADATVAIDQTTNSSAAVDAAPKADVRDTAKTLATLGSGTAPASTLKERWKDLDDTTRYLLIMGTADGFSAAGAGSPCFPGSDNSKIAASLKTAGFDDKDPATLADALAKLSAPREQCAKAPARGYSTDLIKSMSDEHLSIYLSGVVRGYAKIKSCPADNHAYAAATVATDLFALQAPKDPVELIGPAMANGCAFKAN